MGQQGQWTLEQIAAAVQRGRATIIRWVRAYRQGGIAGVLERHYMGERRPPSLNTQERQELKQGLAEGQWKSAREIQRWLKAERHKELTLAAISYWLGQLRASWKVPRKSHKKKPLSRKSSLKRRSDRA
jgi:transposase